MGMGHVVQETPAAVAWGSNRFDVFTVGVRYTVMHAYWNGSQILTEDLGTPDGVHFPGKVSATSWGPGRVNVVALGSDLQYWHIYYDEKEGGWSPWYEREHPGLKPVTGSLRSWPALVSSKYHPHYLLLWAMLNFSNGKRE